MTTAERITNPETGARFYTYPPTGELFASVTTITGATHDKSLYLSPWYAKKAALYAVANLETIAGLVKAGKEDDAVALIAGQAPGERDRKAEAGKYVHAVAEALVLWAASPDGRGGDIVLPLLAEELESAEYDGTPLPEVTDQMVTGFMNFVADFQPVFEAAEMTVFHPGLKVAGTLDIIAALHGVWPGPAGYLTPAPGRVFRPCIDIKTGRYPGETVREQASAYRHMAEALMPMGDIRPMPPTDGSGVLHLRPGYERGYRLTIVPPREDAEAWNTFRRDVQTFYWRRSVSAKPGKAVRPLRPDGTMPQPRLADLDGEGYGRALSPLIKAGVEDLDQLAQMTAGQCLAIKGVASRVLDVIDRMLADHGLTLAGEPGEKVA